MKKLVIPPDQNSYSFTDAEETVLVQLDGGSPRVRTDVLNGDYTLQARWTLDDGNYQYFRNFYKVVLANDAGRFLCDLITDTAAPIQHNCLFVPGSLTLVSQSGLTYVVSAKFMVTAIPQDIPNLEVLIDIVEAYGSVEKAAKALNLLDKLANRDLPRIQP